MYRNSILRQTVLFLIGSVANLAMFCLSKYAGFPVWADFAGSVYITAACGPILGLVSVIIHTALLVILIDGTYALWLCIPALAMCTVVCLYKIREVPFSVANIGALAFVSSLVSFACNWVCFGVIGTFGRRTELAAHLSSGLMKCVAAAGTALLETALTAAVFYIMYLITPKNDDKLKFKR